MANPANTTLTVDGLMAAAFNRPRQPRSSAYCVGVRTFLAQRIEGAPVALPFEPGTAEADAFFAAEADAFFAGEDEGRLILARAWEAEQVA